MFPLRDSIPSQRRPVVTIAIIAASSLTFLYQLTLGPALESFLLANAFVPARFFHPAAFAATVQGNLASLVVSMFLHGGWLHLIGNMWFLWVFGDNVEDTLGHWKYLVFYLVCGAAASLAQGIVAPSSPVPMVGASGAIAGVLGAYLLWFPWSRVKTFLFLGFFATFTELPAPAFLLLWFVVQFFSGTLSLAAAGTAGGGVAWFAHIGGFVAGAAIAAVSRRRGSARPPLRPDLTLE
jgi:membrane associated rhomboid family serine protease